jgi:hypothetical protein
MPIDFHELSPFTKQNVERDREKERKREKERTTFNLRLAKWS